MDVNIPLVLKTILEDYALPLNGDHGVAHWARVLENGLRLAEESGANVKVVQLFAVLHDSRYPDMPQGALSDSLPDRARLDEEAEAVARFG